MTRRTSVPYVPKLRTPTRQQRGAASAIVSRGLQRQGVTREELPSIRRGAAGREAQKRVNRATGYSRTLDRQLVEDVARHVGFTGSRRDLQAAGRQIIAANRAEAKPGGQRKINAAGLATINVGALQNALGDRLAGNPLAATARGLSELASQRTISDRTVLGRTANDLLTFPAAAIPTGYAAVTNPAGLAKGIVDQVTHPGETFSEHPLFGLLLARGGVSVVGRGSGAIARSGALGKGAKEFASTSRPMVGIAGESGAQLRTPRRGSKDLINRTAQRVYDAPLAPVRDSRGRVAVDARGRPVLAAPQGALHPFNKPDRLMRKRADFVASRANAVERNTRAIVAREVQAIQPTREHRGAKVTVRGRTIDTRAIPRALDRSLAAQPLGRMRVLPRRVYRPEKDVVAMAMEGTIRPGSFVSDLKKERGRLEEAYQAYKRGDSDLDPVQRRTNRMRARTIDRVLKDPRAVKNEASVFESAAILSARGNDLAQRAVQQGMLAPEAAARAKLFPYAQSHMGARPVEHSDGKLTLRAADGTFLSNDQIRAHMADPRTGPVVNPDAIAYLPHRGDVRGASAYHQQFRLNRPNLDQESRTGSAYEKGATSTDFSLPLEHLVRASTTLARTSEFDRLIHDVGIKHPGGRYFTWKEAQDWAKRGGRDPGEATNKRLPGEPELVPVRALPAKYDEARAAGIQNQQDVALPGASSHLVHEQTDRFLRPEPGDPNARNVVLVPKVIADRLKENLEPTQSGARAFQAATAAFRTTVLPFSTKWLTGNIVEAILRSGIAGVTPRDPAIGRKLIRTMEKQDPVAAHQTLSHLINGLLYSNKGLTNRRTAEDFAGSVGGTIAHSPPGRAGKGALKVATTPSFFVNGLIEHAAQYGALGKFARQQIQELSGSWWKSMRAQERALEDVAKGLKDTGAQQQAARFLDETLGQYSRFSPKLRFAIQTYAPFLPWYLNSVRFVMWTLPAHHPIKTAVLTQAEQAFQSDWEQQHKDLPPGSGLKTAIPHKGGFVDAARYTPFGLPGPLASGDLGALSGIVLPQTQGLQLAVLGKDPFGEDLKGPDGKLNAGQQILYGVNQAAESYLPGIGIARRAREGGEKSLATSTVLRPQTAKRKPGQPDVSAGNRILNPFRPVYFSKSRTAKGGPPAGMSKGEYESLLREARAAAPKVSDSERDALLREARALAGR